jgi:invasion protein IalB
MDLRIASARPFGRALTATLAAAGFIAFAAPTAFAQAQKPAAKPAAPAKPAPAPQAQQAQPAPQGQPQAGGDQPQLMYSPWMKVCGKGPDTNNKQVCVVTKDGRLENGMPVAIVQLFEPEGEAKVLRVTVPLGMQLAHGTRVLIDQNQPQQSPYKICFPVGCMADYPVTDDMIAKMKKGQNLVVQAINMQGTPISLPLPLGDFANASCRKSYRRRPKRRARSWKARKGRPLRRRRPLRPRRRRSKRLSFDQMQKARLRPRLFICGSPPARGRRNGGSVQPAVAGLVAAGVVPLEHFGDVRVADRLAGSVGQQVLLGDVGDVLRFLVLREQVIEGLVLVRPDLGRDRLPPFLGVVEHRVNVENHTAEREQAVLHHLTDIELGVAHLAHYVTR